MQSTNDRSRAGGRPGGRSARVRAALGAALLAGALATAGCSAAGGGGDEASGVSADRRSGENSLAKSEAETQQQPGAPTTGAGSDGDTAADTAQAAERHVIRTASLTVETEDVQAGVDKARGVVETAGGYVAEESTDRDADGEERSRVTFKVPPEEYDGVLGRLSEVGELLDRNRSTKDVTGEVVDVESRIETQKASVDRVRKLMDDATELSDVVSLESELSTRQADLEALQARLKSLESRSGMATVTLELRAPDAAPVDEDEDEDPTVGGAVSGGWDAFVTMLRWIAVAVGASLPFVVSLAVLYVLWRAMRGRLPRPRARAGTPAMPARPAGAPAVPSPAAERLSKED
jgi:hypothetical protein